MHAERKWIGVSGCGRVPAGGSGRQCCTGSGVEFKAGGNADPHGGQGLLGFWHSNSMGAACVSALSAPVVVQLVRRCDRGQDRRGSTGLACGFIAFHPLFLPREWVGIRMGFSRWVVVLSDGQGRRGMAGIAGGFEGRCSMVGPGFWPSDAACFSRPPCPTGRFGRTPEKAMKTRANWGCWTGWLILGSSVLNADVFARSPEMWESHLVSLAWEAGCLQPEECGILETALFSGASFRWTQQGVASLFGQERRLEVVSCLRRIPEWRAVFSASLSMPVPLKSSEVRWRWDGRKEAPGRRSGEGRMHWSSSDPKGHATGLRIVRSDGSSRLESAYMRRASHKGTFWGGTLSARFGQGLVMWTTSPFDDLGGMEGTHRLGRGLGFIRTPFRGMILGAGWQHNNAMGRRWRGWGMVGRVWPDLTGMLAAGADHGRWAWTVKWQEQKTDQGAWLTGLHGKVTHGGWSTRWAAAGFRNGWVGRVSVLRTWSKRWEAHAAWERTHPRHPRWMSGEMRSSMPSPDDLPGAVWMGGLAFTGERGTSGWSRWSVRWEGPPPFRLKRQSAFRWTWGDHRVDFRTQWGPARGTQVPNSNGQEATSWMFAFRKEMEGGDERICRIHFILAGKSSDMGGALAVTWGWKQGRGGRFRLGLGQSFGSENAPIAYVSGWDGRPAEPFRGSDFKGFFRWHSPGGNLRVGLQLGMREGKDGAEKTATIHGIHAIRVEFRPRWS